MIVDNLGIVSVSRPGSSRTGTSRSASPTTSSTTRRSSTGSARPPRACCRPARSAGMASTQFDEQCGAIEEYYPEAKVSSSTPWSGASARSCSSRACGRPAAPTGRALVRALESGHRFDFGGLVPALSYGPGKRLPYDLTATVEVSDGNWVRTGPLYTPESRDRPGLGPSARRRPWRRRRRVTGPAPARPGRAARSAAPARRRRGDRAGCVHDLLRPGHRARGRHGRRPRLQPPGRPRRRSTSPGWGPPWPSLAYSPYSDAAGVINAFGGTSLPLGRCRASRGPR